MVRVRGFVDAASFCWAPNVSVDVMNSEKEDMRGGATLLVCTAVGLSFLILFIADLVAPFFKVVQAQIGGGVFSHAAGDACCF